MPRERGQVTVETLELLTSNPLEKFTRDDIVRIIDAPRRQVDSAIKTLTRSGEIEWAEIGYWATPTPSDEPAKLSVWELDEQVVADTVEEMVESMVHELTKDARYDISVLGLVEQNRKMAVEALTTLVLLAGPINN